MPGKDVEKFAARQTYMIEQMSAFQPPHELSRFLTLLGLVNSSTSRVVADYLDPSPHSGVS